jgi:hypothetical protein
MFAKMFQRLNRGRAVKASARRTSPAGGNKLSDDAVRRISAAGTAVGNPGDRVRL